MGATIDTGDAKGRKSVNVELNIIPFIDVMACLTAFLLVSAVWVDISQLDIRPAGKARDVPLCEGDRCDDPKLSLLVESDRVWIGVSRVDEFQEVLNTPAGHDWAKVEQLLAVHKRSSFFEQHTDIEVAASSTATAPIPYGELIAAMDTARHAGFLDVGLTDPNGLSARPIR